MNNHETTEARALIAYLLAQGCELDVYDGEERTVTDSTDADAVFAALATTDVDELIARRPDHRSATFVLIYGNGPGELIADHSDNPFANAAWQHVQDTAVPMAYR